MTPRFFALWRASPRERADGNPLFHVRTIVALVSVALVDRSLDRSEH